MRPTFANMVAVTAVATRLKPARTARVLKHFFSQLAEATWATGAVKVPGLGAFRVRARKPRRMTVHRSVRVLPAERVVICRVAKSWRRRDA